MTFNEIMEKNQVCVPFHIELSPWLPEQQDHILIEIAVAIMQAGIKGDFNPEKVRISENKKRKIYVAFLPQILVDLLIYPQMPRPKKLGDAVHTSYWFIKWTPEPARYWATMRAENEATPAPPTAALKIVLDNIFEKKGLNITNLKPNLRKAEVKCLTGTYHVHITINEEWTPTEETPDRSLKDLKLITIEGKHWHVELSHNITHFFGICVECYEPLPKDNEFSNETFNKWDNTFTSLEQQPFEDQRTANDRLRKYIITAVHNECRKKPIKCAASLPCSFQDMLNKRAKELAKEEEALKAAEKTTAEEPTA